MSHTTPLSEMEISSVPPTQSSIYHDLATEHRPIATLDNDALVGFVRTTGDDEYIRFKETMLAVTIQVSIEKSNRSVVTETDWAKVTPAENLMHSLFKQVDLLINGVKVIQYPQTYPYRAYIETITSYSASQRKSLLSSVGFFEDDVTARARLLLSKPVSEKGRFVDMMGRLHIDLSFQDKAMIGGLNYKLSLQPNAETFFHQSQGKDFITKFKFIKTSLFVHRSKISLSLLEAHQYAIKLASAKYAFTRAEVKPVTIGNGLMDVMIDNVMIGQLPRRAIIAFLDHMAFKGDISKDPFEFKDLGLNFLAVYLDGVQYPSQQYTPDFETGNVTREFFSLYQSLNQLNTDNAMHLTLNDYKNGKTMFEFNFSPDLSDGCSGLVGHVNSIKEGTFSIIARFQKTLENPIIALIYCEFDNIMETNQHKQIKIGYGDLGNQ